MSDDPGGLYARLDVRPTAPAAEIAAAFRRKARVLHPDVPGTGDTAAFIRVKEAYDVLGDALRRAAYDRAARASAAPAPGPIMPPPPRGPRLADLPVGLLSVLGVLFCVAAVMAALQLGRDPPPAPRPVIRPFAPPGPAAEAPLAPPAVVTATGVPTSHYVAASADAVLWRGDPAHDTFRPAGRIPSFTPVLALRLVAERGLVEIRLADGGSGFIDAARLTPGDRAAARRAFCAYNAGPTPQNGEVLSRRDHGPARLEINNRTAQPAVVKLRDVSGRAAVTVFVAAGARTTVTDLPDDSYRPDFALGELWSRACNDFAAGTRAKRFTDYQPTAVLSPLEIPPGLSAGPAPVDIPDAAFERD